MVIEPRLDSTAPEYRCGYKCISWSAIIIGSLVGLGLSFLFHLFSMAIGLTAFNAATGNTLAIGGLLGILISVLVSTFAGGWVSGYLAKPTCYNEYMGVLYGFTTWCLALLLTAWMSFHISNMLSANYRNLAHPEVINITENMINSATDTNDTRNASDQANNPEKQRNATNQPQTNEHRDSATASASNAAPALGVALFVVFLMFFLGAISSCFGGYFGLRCHCGERDRPTV